MCILLAGGFTTWMELSAVESMLKQKKSVYSSVTIESAHNPCIPCLELKSMTTMLTSTSSRNKTGSWIGNSWIPPPGWRLFSAKKMLDLYKDKTVLFMGDSMARRLAVTLYETLNLIANSIDSQEEPVDVPYTMLEDNLAKSGKDGSKCTMIKKEWLLR
jgi:hypothetical protein